jgi:hypothetical protein
MIEGSGSILLNSRSGSGRPKNMLIRIWNTAKNIRIGSGTLLTTIKNKGRKEKVKKRLK